MTDIYAAADALVAAATPAPVGEPASTENVQPAPVEKAKRRVLSGAEKVADLRSRAVALNEQADKLEAELAAAEKFAALGAGTRVVVKVGRAETRREVEGDVLQRIEEEGRVYFKVLANENGSVELFRVQQFEVVRIVE